MGADIHVFIEQKTISKNEPLIAEWISIDEWVYDPYFEETCVKNPYWSDRNYLLFAILADLRNVYSIHPISLPRGLPDDISVEVKTRSDIEGDDAHTRSWLTLKELLEYDWKQPFWDDNNVCYPLEEMVIAFVNEFIPRLIKIDEPENVRLVFWLDN